MYTQGYFATPEAFTIIDEFYCNEEQMYLLVNTPSLSGFRQQSPLQFDAAIWVSQQVLEDWNFTNAIEQFKSLQLDLFHNTINALIQETTRVFSELHECAVDDLGTPDYNYNDYDFFMRLVNSNHMLSPQNKHFWVMRPK